MVSYQHLVELYNLYREKALGTSFYDPIAFEQEELPQGDTDLPSEIGTLHKTISSCHLCDLSKSRSSVQTAYGSDQASIMIVGDYPSLAEDSEGAYSGKAGQMLEDMFAKVVGLTKDKLYYTHAVKCLPLNGKQPTESEIVSCKPFLLKQIALVKPKIIVALGELSYNYLTGDNSSFESIRGEFIPFGDCQLIAIYHPRFLRLNPSKKSIAMTDLTTIKRAL